MLRGCKARKNECTVYLPIAVVDVSGARAGVYVRVKGGGKETKEERRKDERDGRGWSGEIKIDRTRAGWRGITQASTDKFTRG